MGWAARSNPTAQMAKRREIGPKQQMPTHAPRADAKKLRVPIAAMLLGAFGLTNPGYKPDRLQRFIAPKRKAS